MNSFFNFTRAEWSAVIFIVLLLLGSLFFSRLTRLHKKTQLDFASFETEISHFIRTQQFISDSLEQEKKNKRTYSRSGNNSYTLAVKADTSKRMSNHDKDRYRIIKVNVNRCDTSDIERIPLFGNKRAAKLIEYRHALGGYYDLEQLHEIFIMQSVSKQHLEKYFYVDTTAIVKIRINHAEYRELISHPYFDAYLTKSVLHYRQKNGAIHDLEEFKKATHAYPELLEKLKPYLTFEE